LTQAQTAGQYFTNDQIKEMTRKVSAEVDLVHQQTQNQRYGSSHIGATAKDISNVVTDAASGVVDIFHGIDKAVADTWNSGMALLILALLQRIFLMSSLMLLLVWLIFFMVLIKLLPILGTISGKTRSEERRVGKECRSRW